MPKGTLLNKLNAPIEPRQIKSWAEQILLGLSELHQLNIIHCDIAPGNIFVNKDDKIVIGDLGVATSVKWKKKDIFYCGEKVRLRYSS